MMKNVYISGVYNKKDGAREMSSGSGRRGPCNLWEALDNSKTSVS